MDITHTLNNKIVRATMLVLIISSLFISITYVGSVSTVYGATALDVGDSLHYQFKVAGTLHEAGSMNESSSPYFWLNSGGKLQLENGTGKTVHGALKESDVWHTLYSANNSLDTDGGDHPQNLFRLVTRSKWEDVEQAVRFKVSALNLSDSPNRDGYSGLLLMSRYQDGDNLYYAGVRMDGKAVIKKKYKGTYYTLASKQVFTSDGLFNRLTNPSLIPTGQWLGLKSITKTKSDGSVVTELWLDEEDNGAWKKLLTVTDKPGAYGKGVVDGAAYAGVRTDFMDVVFDDYRLKEL